MIILNYLSLNKYPSRYANRLQTIKMSEAFSRISDFNLYLESFPDTKENVFWQYGVTGQISINTIGGLSFFIKPKSLFAAFKLRHIISGLRNHSIFYTRDVLLTFWLSFISKAFKNNYFFELHTLSRFPKFIYRRVLSNSRGIITTNERKKKDLMSIYNINEERILVFGNGIDINEFNSLPEKTEAREKLGLKIDGKYIVYAGTLKKEYGSEILDNLRDNLPAYTELITITGRSRKESILYMASADILIAPYINASDHFMYYMSPIKIKEYMASSRPILASDLPSIREILNDNEAFFARDGDSNAFLSEVNYILENPKEAEEKAKNAKNKASEYSWDRRAERIISFIEESHE